MKKWKVVKVIICAFVVFLLSGMPVKAAENVHENNVEIIMDTLVNQKDHFTLQKENGDIPDFVSEYREACNVNHNAFYFSIYNIEEITFTQDDNLVHYKISYNTDRENIELSLQDSLEGFVSQYGDISQYSDRKKFAAISDYIIGYTCLEHCFLIRTDVKYCKLIFIGGTSQMLKEQIQDRYPNAFIPEDSGFTNAEGFMKGLCIQLRIAQ